MPAPSGRLRSETAEVPSPEGARPTPDGSVSERLARATERVRGLMEVLGRQELGSTLQSRGWTFAFDRARRRLGSCQFGRRGGSKRITLSRHLAATVPLDYRDANGLRVVEDVIRHEIAHAIDYERRGRSDHGRRWKSICLRIGADPTRTYDSDHLPQPPAKYTAICPNCARETAYYRVPRAAPACGSCCREHNRGRYSARFRLSIRKNY